MSVHNDLLNDEMKVLHEQSSGEPEPTQMCSYCEDELGDMCSSWQDDTYRNRREAGAESLINQRVPGFWQENGCVFFVLIISPRKLILPLG